MTLYLLILTALIHTSCEKAESPETTGQLSFQFATAHSLLQRMDSLAALSDSAMRVNLMNAVYDTLKHRQELPFTRHDTVVFIYKGLSQPTWAGDFNGWNPDSQGWKGNRIGQTNFWMLLKQFPTDARLDYKVVVGNNWNTDPSNPRIQYSGWGPNSFFAMPDWQFPEETKLREGVVQGTLSNNIQIQSIAANLGYKVNYRVYLPWNYQANEAMPVIYVTDGHEYADPLLGAMTVILDNLIYSGEIVPVIAVFIDPRDPVTGQNRRMDEYRANVKFANFVADELTAAIDTQYKTLADAAHRAILGTSLGGWNSVWIGATRSDKFQLIGIHSPAFDQAIINQYAEIEQLPLKLFMSTGTIFDTQDRARNMKTVLEQKGYPLQYIEVNEGHSWGNWRAVTDLPLLYFFGSTSKP